MPLALASALSLLLALQAVFLLCRLPGLLSVPRSTPRALWPLFAGLAGLGAAWLVGEGRPVALAGLPLGLLLAVALPCLAPMLPEVRLLCNAHDLAVLGHEDACAVLLRPEGRRIATVFFAHGVGNDRAFGLWALVPRLLERGCAVALFNMAGHGRGGRDLASIETLRARYDAVLAAVREEAAASDGGPLIAMGQSMGGAMTLDAVARGVRFDAAATVSAIVRMDLGLGLLRELGIVFHRAAWRAFRYGTACDIVPAAGGLGRRRYPVRVARGKSYIAVFAEVLETFSLPERLRAAAPGFPILVVHGTADGIVPIAQGRALAAALGERAEYFEVPGVHHIDPLFHTRVIERLLLFVSSVAEAYRRSDSKH